MTRLQPALLALADGTLFHGASIGASGSTAGEVVFNTAMTGYQEILTDPSYRLQIVTLTCPHIGNVGVNPEDEESDRVQLAGLVLREPPRVASSWRAKSDFSHYLMEQGVIAIAGIDTRHLTRILRTRGAQGGCIISGHNIDSGEAIEQARTFPGLKGMDLAQVVTTDKAYAWTRGGWQMYKNGEAPSSAFHYHVVAYDFGVKTNILRMLVDRGCRVTVVPAQTAADDVMRLKPDGVFFSNGPGDPEPCDYAINAMRAFIAARVPLFGICLGHQLLGLAAGGKTLKMKFGHHGANHPVQDLETGRVMITSQNHGFAVDESSLPPTVSVTHRSLFDGTNQGIRLLDAPAFSFQGHPEASPGPHDADALFDRFITLMEAARDQAN